MINSSSQATTKPVLPIEYITPRTVVAFLTGDEAAIRLLANSKCTVKLGLAFVMSAGLAREYDHEDLLHEPWHLFIPLLASIATSVLLYAMITLLAMRRGVALDHISYRSFLGLYWMTAPLAWVYGIPVERMATEEAAVQLNLAFLGLVAFWRVVLIIRSIQVVYGAGLLDALPLVMVFADLVMLALLQVSPLPVFSLMSGVRQTDGEQLIAFVSFLAPVVGILGMPVLMIPLLVSFIRSSPWEPISSADSIGEITRSTWYLAVFGIVSWCSVLPMTQPEQQLRYQAERLLRFGRLNEATALMSRHESADFPPYWDPPPRVAYYRLDTYPHVADVLDVLIDKPNNWVRQIYLEKLSRQLGGYSFEWSDLRRMKDDERRKVLSVIERLPERLKLLERSSVRQLLDGVVSSEDRTVSEESRQCATALLELFKQREREPTDDNVKL